MRDSMTMTTGARSTSTDDGERVGGVGGGGVGGGGAGGVGAALPAAAAWGAKRLGGVEGRGFGLDHFSWAGLSFGLDHFSFSFSAFPPFILCYFFKQV